MSATAPNIHELREAAAAKCNGETLADLMGLEHRETGVIVVDPHANQNERITKCTKSMINTLNSSTGIVFINSVLFATQNNHFLELMTMIQNVLPLRCAMLNK